MKKVWFVSHYSMPPEYEMRIKTQMYAKILKERGYDTKIFSASTIHNTDINLINGKEKFICRNYDGQEFVHIKCSNYSGNGISRIINMLQFSYRFPKIAKKFPLPDVIVADANCINYEQIWKFCKKNNIMLCIDVRDLWPLSIIKLLGFSEKHPIIKYLFYRENKMYKRSDSIIYSFEGGKEYIIDRGLSTSQNGYIDLNKVYYINNGVDLNIFNTQKEEHIFIDKDLDDNSIFKVIYTGSIRRANCVDYIVKSASIIKEKGYNNIKFIIFGDGHLKSELEQYCISKRLDNVIFKGIVDKKYIANILSKSDLNIFTGEKSDLYKYGLSLNKMFDYMASGKPILSNIECGYDILESYRCGITVEAGNINAIVEGVIKFYNMSKNEYKEYCKNAILASQEYDFKKLTDKLEQVINIAAD